PIAATCWRMLRLRRSMNAVLMCQPHAAKACSTASRVPNTTRCVTRTRRRLRVVLITCAYSSPGSGIQRGLGGIRMKLSIDNCCKFNGFMLLSQTRAEYLCCCASFSRGLGRQTFCGGTGMGEKAAECQLGLKDHLHPSIGQSLVMSDEFEQTQF